MAQLTRVTHTIFGSTAGTAQVAVFGSLAAGSPVFTNNAGSIQQLSNWAEGWYGAVLGGNSPAMQDFNAFCFEHSYQVAYLLQQGMAEYDASTVYYKNSFCQGSNGIIYQSLTNSNTGSNPLLGSPWTAQWISKSNLPTVNYVVGSPTGAFNYTGTTFTDIATVTITTTGRPVELRLQAGSNTAGNTANISFMGLNGNTDSGGAVIADADFRFLDGTLGSGSQLCCYAVKLDSGPGLGSGHTVANFVPSSAMSFIYTPPAGTYTYYVDGRLTIVEGSAMALFLEFTSLVAREL